MMEDFPICGVCRKPLSDADAPKGAHYCKMCSMLIQGIGGFCCEKCERIFKWFNKQRWKERGNNGKGIERGKI